MNAWWSNGAISAADGSETESRTRVTLALWVVGKAKASLSGRRGAGGTVTGTRTMHRHVDTAGRRSRDPLSIIITLQTMMLASRGCLPAPCARPAQGTTPCLIDVLLCHAGEGIDTAHSDWHPGTYRPPCAPPARGQASAHVRERDVGTARRVRAAGGKRWCARREQAPARASRRRMPRGTASCLTCFCAPGSSRPSRPPPAGRRS